MRLLKSSLKIFLLFNITVVYNTYAQSFQLPENQDKTIKIGLLIPDNKSVAAKHGAELAVRDANRKGGMNGIPFQLVTRYLDGAWGTGSKEAVNLIFEEKVWALLGSHDGRNAHIVEQAATKANVVFLSAWAGDPTLSQAFVPWFFNCVPDDRQQSELLVEEIYNNRKADKVAVVSDNAYDSKQLLKNFLSLIKVAGGNEPFQFIFEKSADALNVLTDHIREADVNCIVLFCQPSVSLIIIRHIRQLKMNQPLFGSISLPDENQLSGQELDDLDNILLIPSEYWSESKSSAFIREFTKSYGEMPGMVAAYAHDGMNLLIEAIKEAGVPEREKIQKSLGKIHYDGVTGLIRFDERGNREGTLRMTKLKNGIPVIL